MNINQSTISTSAVMRPTVVEVNLQQLANNFHAIREKVGSAKIMPILKANAYGHGLVEIARLMESLGADYLGVAVLEEGIMLREVGVKAPILVLGGILGSQIPAFIENDLTITASSVEKLCQVEMIADQIKRKARVHLKIDTGMERIGVHYYNAKEIIDASLKCKHLEVEGIFSHFANSESADLSHARLQIERFDEILSYYEVHGIQMPCLRHMANSGAILQLPEAYYDMVRPGIMVYGIYPSSDVMRSVEIHPALKWKSRVVYFKVIKPGHPVGYGSTWQTDQMVRAVTVPVGYGDGYLRNMSHKAQVLIRGKRYPVIGHISMDQIVVNIGWDSAYNNDEVVLIGEMQGEVINPEDLADWAETIPYEILTNINTRVPRVYFR